MKLSLERPLQDLLVNIQQLEKKSERLSCQIPEIDQFFEGGLKFGTLIEWGMPIGLNTRRLLLPYLARATQQGLHVLWVNSLKDLFIFPPAWFAYALQPKYMLFANTSQPFKDLKRAFMNPLIKIFVIDGSLLSKDEYAYLAQQARRNQQIFLIIKNHYLSVSRGNALTSLRLNVFTDDLQKSIKVHVVRGKISKQCTFNADLLRSE